MTNEQETHQRHSARLKKYDYGQSGAYFVTVCTKGKECLFGKVINNKIELNNIGIIATSYWIEIPHHFQNVVLDAFIIMPNHIHGILLIDNLKSASESTGGRRGAIYRAPTIERKYGPPVSGSLGTIILAFKAAVTRKAHEMRGISGVSVWQRNYYEHIIRSERDLDKIRAYIAGNPTLWDTDNLKDDIRRVLE